MSRLDEKRFTALGEVWIARFDFNASCAIEEETGKGFYEFVAPLLVQLDEEDAEDPAKVLDAMKALRKSDVRLILFHALAGQHEGITLHDVGEIIQDIGFGEAMQIAAWAVLRALPGSADDEHEGGATSAENPPVNRKERQAQAAKKKPAKSAAKRG